MTSSRRSLGRRIARHAAAFGAIVVVVALVLAASAAGYLSTRSGKAALLGWVIGVLDQALPGRIVIGELVELGFGAVVLDDVRVLAPSGNEVIRVGRVSAEVGLAALLHRQIAIRSGRLEGGHVDLRRLVDSDAGLVGAFVSAAPAGKPSGAPAPVVSIESVHASGLSVVLPEAPALGALELRQVELEASVHVGAALAIAVRGARAKLHRSALELGELELDGTTHDGQASRLALRGTVCGGTLALTARSSALDFAGFASMPLEADIEAGGWSKHELGCLLGEPAAASLPPGPSRAELHTGGTLERLELAGALASAAGTLEVAGVVRAARALDLRLETSALRLGALHAGLPALQLAAELDVSLAQFGAGALRLDMRARSQLDGAAVPPLRLQAILDGTSLREIDLRVVDGASTLGITGAASLSGTTRLTGTGQIALGTWSSLGRALLGNAPELAGRLEVDASLVHQASGGIELAATFASDELGVEGIRVQRIGGRASLSGRWPAPAVDLDVRFGDQRRPDAAFGRLQIGGAQRQYTVEALARFPDWGPLELRGSLGLLAGGARVTLSGTGSARGVPWQVELPHGELFEDGRASFPAAELSLHGQRAHLSAARSRSGWSGTAELADADLTRLLAPFGLATQPRGNVSSRLVLRGTSSRPVVDVDVTGERLGLGDGPRFEGRLRGSIDVNAGAGELEASMSEAVAAGVAPRLSVALQARGELANSGSWWRRLLHGKQHVEVHAARLESSLLEELLRGPLPLGFDARGDVVLGLDRGRPALQLTVLGSAGGRPRASGVAPAPLRPDDQLDLRLVLDGGNTSLRVSLADRAGTWLLWSGGLELAKASAIPELLLEAAPSTALTRLAEEATWSTQLTFSPRPLTYVPLLAAPVELRDARLEARLEARRARGQAPTAQLELQLAGAKRSAAGSCAPRGLVTRLLVNVDADRFRAELDAAQGQRELLRARATGRLALAPLLRGESLALTELVASADAKRLQLGELPYWCERVRGSVDTSARLQVAPGVPPSLTATLGVEGFSTGGEPTVDVSLALGVEASRLHANGSVGQAPRRSTFELNLPLAAAGRTLSLARDRPVDAKLSLVALDVAPFLADFAGLSHARGTLNGAVTLGGTIDDPKLAGELKVEGGSFTSTELAQSFEEVGATLELGESFVLIEHLAAHDGRGSLAVEGRIDRLGPGAFDAGIDVVARKFPLRQAGQVVATTSATARVDAKWRPGRRDVQVGLREVDTWLESAKAKGELSLNPHPDLEVDDATARRPRRDQRDRLSEKSVRVPLSLHLDAGEQFWVKRADFGVKLTASLQIVDPGSSGPAAPPPSITGNVGFDRGYLALLGRNFTVKPGGSLRFTGASSAMVDLTAIYEDRRTDEVLEVHVSGSADAPKLDFSIDGAHATPAEAMRAIYGNTDSDASTEDPNNAEVETKQFLSALTAGVLNASIRRTLGAMAPIVTLAPTDDEGGGELRAGFELDSLIPDFLRDIVTGVYVEGIFSSDKASEQYGRRELQPGVLMELFFPYNLVTSGRYGPDSTWSLDLGWHP